MKRAWHFPAKLLTGFFVAAMYAMPQATVSARPGVINYIEGQVYWNGLAISPQDLGPRLQLNATDTLSTTNGKVEVLLNPGVFLRLGNNTQIRMISPTLVDPQIEVTQGEAIVEVVQLVKGNQVQITDSGASVILRNTGVYRITTQPQPAIAVYAGKAEALLNGRSREAGKGHQILLVAGLPEQNFDTNASDDLYVWSNTRSEYDAGASYAALRSLYTNNPGGFYSPGSGWYWNGGWDSWAWFPARGYCFSPFGWGFYSPAYVGYAPVVLTNVGGHYGGIPISPKAPLAGGPMPRTPNSPARATSAAVSAKALLASARAASPGRTLSIASRSGGGQSNSGSSRGGSGVGSGGSHGGGGSSGGSGGGHASGGGGSSGGSSGGGGHK